MSKKNKKNFENAASSTAVLSHGAEYRIIKHDLIKVLILNVIYLAAIITLYITNSKAHYLQQWFGGWLHF